MTKEQFVDWANSADKDQIADFVDKSNFTLYEKNGPGDTDGVEAGESYDGFSVEDKAYILGNIINRGIGGKVPC